MCSPDLSDSVLGSVFNDNSFLKVPQSKVEVSLKVEPQSFGGKEEIKDSRLSFNFHLVKLPVTREQLIVAQQNDPSLHKCFKMVVSVEAVKEKSVAYFLENGLLLRKLSSAIMEGMEWGVVYQIVVPTGYRQSVLSLAHENPWSGHFYHENL